jgi:hypothetical protein
MRTDRSSPPGTVEAAEHIAVPGARARAAFGLLALVAAFVVLLVISSQALASEALEAPWSASGPGSVSVSSNGTSPPARMSYSIKPAGEMTPRTWTFSAKAGATGTKELTYGYSGWHGSLAHGTVFLSMFVTHEGITTRTSLVSANLGNNGNFSYVGDVSFNVHAGDTYGFEFGGESDDWVYNEMSGTLTVGLQHGLPVNIAPPEISGSPKVNMQLTASTGSWEGATSYEYQWLLCDPNGEGCYAVEHDSGSTLVPPSYAVGDSVRVRVIARNSFGEASAESAPTGTIPRIEAVGGGVMEDGTESALFWASGLYAASPGGLLPWGSKLCAQWRRSPSEPWAESCGEIEVSPENFDGCLDANGYQEVSCFVEFRITGLEPGTEYEARAWTTSGGSEEAGEIDTFTTEGEGPPRSGGAPTLSGEPRAGKTLEVIGEWTGLRPITFSYKWERCVQETHTCTPISQATGSTYEIPAGDVAKTSESPYTLRASINAGNQYGEQSATSEEREVLAAPATFTTTGPELSGEATEGQTLTVSHYAIAGLPAPAVTYEWRRCNAAGESCAAITGAEGATYVPTSQDLQHTIRAVVKASNAEYRGGAAVSETTPQSALVVAAIRTCAAGSFSLTGEEPCTPATPGHFAAGTGATSQTACAAGTYDALSGSTSSSECLTDPSGSYSAPGASSASLCAKGTYAPTPGLSSCSSASPGYYVALTGSSEQTPCVAGTYNPEGSSTSSSACLSTPPGTWSAAASAHYTKCPAGSYEPEYGATSSAACRADPPGTYTQEFASAVERCNPGSYAEGTGNTACRAASPGYYVEDYEAAAELPCEPGYYASGEGSPACSEAQEGHYAEGTGATSQTVCAKGTYAPAAGLSSCRSASPGYYVAATGAFEQTPCNAGTYNPEGSSTSASGCLSTPPGAWSSAASAAYTKCPAGSYEPEYGATSSAACRADPPGTYTQEFASAVEHCNPGSYAEGTGNTACTPATPGHYAAGTGATSQTACAAGTYNALSGSTSSSACLTDPTGSYSAEGASSASLCLKGTYAPTSGLSSCRSASPGYYVALTGSSEETPCVAGTYNPEGSSTSSSACLSTPAGAWSGVGSAVYSRCPAGSYEPEYGATSSAACRADPPGTYTQEFAPAVERCNPGSYAEGTGNTACRAASRGYYVEDYEAAAELPCEPGYYASGEGSANCTEAPAGSYDSTQASIAPVPCPAGTYAAATRATSCTTTPPDTYSTGGATKPTPCPPETEAPAGASRCTAKASEGAREPASSGETPTAHEPVTQQPSSPSTPEPTTGVTHTVAQPGAPSEVAPVISGLSVARPCIASRALATAKRSARKRHNGLLAARFRLNEAARVTYTLVRLTGSRAGYACPAPKPAPRDARGKRMASGSLASAPGTDALPEHAFTSLLAPGAYELTLAATNAHGMRSAAVSIEMWVLPSRSKR